MLFEQSEDKKEIAEILNARVDLLNGVSEKLNEKELTQLFERYKKACHVYMERLKNIMAVAMVGAKLSGDDQVNEAGLNTVKELQEFMKNMLSDVYCMEVKVADVVSKKDVYMGDYKKTLAEQRARLTLRGEAENLKKFVEEIQVTPGKYAKFDIDGKNPKKVAKESKAVVANFKKLVEATLVPFEWSRAEARAALQKENQNKR